MDSINHEEIGLLGEYLSFYHSWYLSGRRMTKEQRADFYDSIFKYGFYGEEPRDDSDQVILISFEIVRNQLDKALIRRATNKANGRKGGIAKAEAQRIRKNIQDQNMEHCILANSSNCQNISNIDTDKDIEKEKEKSKERDIENYIENNRKNEFKNDGENSSSFSNQHQQEVDFIFNLITETKVDYEQFVKIKKYKTEVLFQLIEISLNNFTLEEIENAYLCYRKEYINQEDEIDVCGFLMDAELIGKFSSVKSYKDESIKFLHG